MKKILLFLVAFTSFTAATAQNFTADGINYTITSATQPLTVAVANNSAFTGVLVIPETVTNANITYSVTSINDNAFYNCSGLTSVTIGNSVLTIGSAAFFQSIALTSVTIGNSVTSVGGYAFYDCSAITSLTIGNSVTFIGDSAFYNCSDLLSVTIPNSVTFIDGSAFAICSALTSVTISDSVTSIGYYTFAYCTALTSVTIPNSVLSIGDDAFYGCAALTSVTIPDSVTSIGYYAFAYCTALTSLTIGNSVTSIEDEAFYGCNALTSVTCMVPTPLIINSSVFGGGYQANCDLYVLPSSQADYSNALVWEDFRSVLLGTSGFVKANFLIYPNPVSSVLTIELQNNLELQNVNFYNTLGQLVKTSKTRTTNVSKLTKGNYFVEVITNQGKATKTIVIE